MVSSRLPRPLRPRPRLARFGLGCLVALGVAAGAASPASAQVRDAAPAVSTGDAVELSGTARSYVADWLVNPERQLEIGGELTFVTAPESPFPAAPGEPGRKLRLTDVGLFQPHVRYSTGGHIEVAAALSLLAKQPSYLDEPVVQAGSLGLRDGLGHSWALWATGAGGQLLGDAGNWGSLAVGAQARTSIDRTIRFQASLGGAATQLYAGDDSGRPWFAEIVAHGEAVLRSPRGEVGTWLGVDYRVPVAHDGGTVGLDPSVRLGLQVGALIGYVDKWDLYVAASAVNRGDIEDPRTTLPILDGGFDQTQIMFGGARRFDIASGDDKDQALRMAQ